MTRETKLMSGIILITAQNGLRCICGCLERPLFAELLVGTTVLDLGCGSGTDTPVAAR